MIYQVFKPLLVTLFFVISLSVVPVHAGYCDDIDLDNPNPVHLICPIVRFVNVFLMFGGVVLLIMIVWGAIKLSMSFGDAKGLAGAQLSWTWMVVGFFILVGFFLVYVIIVNLLGIKGFATPDAIFQELMSRWEVFLKQACVIGNEAHCSH